MLDLNSHILPGIHAATPDITASLDAARSLVAAGVTHAVAPAVVGDDPRSDIAAADGARNALRAAIADAELSLEVLPGAVIPFDALESIPDDVLMDSTIGGGGRWLLATLPDRGWPLGVTETIRGLELRGLGIVVAHPEWSESVQLSPDRLRDLLGRGALVQIAAGSLSGAHGPRAERTAFALLRGGMVNVVASDEPSKLDHSLALDRALDDLEAALRRPRAEVAWMVDAGPRRIAAGEPVRPPRLVPQPREGR